MTLKTNTRLTPSVRHGYRKFSLSPLSLPSSDVLRGGLDASIIFELSHMVQLHQEHSPPDNPFPQTFLSSSLSCYLFDSSTSNRLGTYALVLDLLLLLLDTFGLSLLLICNNLKGDFTPHICRDDSVVLLASPCNCKADNKSYTT